MSRIRKKKNHNWNIAVMMVIILIGICGMAYAKYIQQSSLTETLQVTADIGVITLNEHQALRNADGSYSLNTVLLPQENDPSTEADDVVGNSYKLLPGLDIPKDPFVTVKKETDISVYVYLKVESGISNETITFTVDENYWKHIATESSGEMIYVYYDKSKDVAIEVGEISSDLVIPVLKNNKIYVGQELVHFDLSAQQLDFSAAMFQTDSGENETDVYQKNKGGW